LYSFIDEQGINYEELETTHVQNKSIVYKSTKGSREKINLYRMMRMRMLMKTYLFQRKTWYPNHTQTPLHVLFIRR